MIRYLAYIVLVALIATTIILVIAHVYRVESVLYSKQLTCYADAVIAGRKNDGRIHFLYINRIPSYALTYQELGGYTLVLRVSNEIENTRVKPVECRVYVYIGTESYLSRVQGFDVGDDIYKNALYSIENGSIAIASCDQYIEISNIGKKASGKTLIIAYDLAYELTIKPSDLGMNAFVGAPNEDLGTIYAKSSKYPAYRDFLYDIASRACRSYLRRTDIVVVNILAPTREHFYRLTLAYTVTLIVLLIDYKRDPDNYKWVSKLTRKIKNFVYRLIG